MTKWMVQRTGASSSYKRIKIAKNDGIAYVIEKHLLFSMPKAASDISITNKSSIVMGTMAAFSNVYGYLKVRTACTKDAHIESPSGLLHKVNPYIGEVGNILPGSTKVQRGNGGVSTGILSSVKSPLVFNLESVSINRVFQPASVSNRPSGD